MSRYVVFHTNNFRLNADWHFKDENAVKNESTEHKIRMADYHPVAFVMSKALGDVFRITNHIDELWWENPEVLWYKDESRSTSVGDVVLDLETRKTYICLSYGWGEFTNSERWVEAALDIQKEIVYEAGKNSPC